MATANSKDNFQVLEECCLKQGYDVDSHALHHGGKPIDDSLMFRLTGLPNNATLELVHSEKKAIDGEVEVALQSSDGRKIAKFLSSTTLTDMLKRFSVDFGVDLIKADQGKTPTLMYFNKQVWLSLFSHLYVQYVFQWKGESLLASTTLKSMGITSGRVLLRYSISEFSEAEKAQMEQTLLAENERRKKMTENFAKQKAENDARAILEAKYQKELEERNAAEKKRLEAEMKEKELQK